MLTKDAAKKLVHALIQVASTTVALSSAMQVPYTFVLYHSFYIQQYGLSLTDRNMTVSH